MKLILLGTGSSEGVPVLGCKCAVCVSNKPFNIRCRQSLYIESKSTKLVIDPGQDFRYQMFSNNLVYLDAILVTHSHFDHIGGMNDIRAVCAARGTPVPVFADESTFVDIKKMFDYLLKDIVYVGDVRIPAMSQNTLNPYHESRIGDISFVPFLQKHGSVNSLGFKFKNFVYSTDLKSLPDKSVDLIRGADLWFVDCLGYGNYSGHFNLDDTLRWIKEVRPKKAILIHMSHAIDYYDLGGRLPSNVVLGHDKMLIRV